MRFITLDGCYNYIIGGFFARYGVIVVASVSSITHGLAKFSTRVRAYIMLAITSFFGLFPCPQFRGVVITLYGVVIGDIAMDIYYGDSVMDQLYSTLGLGT